MACSAIPNVAMDRFCFAPFAKRATGDLLLLPDEKQIPLDPPSAKGEAKHRFFQGEAMTKGKAMTAPCAKIR